jgi:hypothetical protein
MDVKKVTREYRLHHWIQIIKECHQSVKEAVTLTKIKR